MKPAEYEYLLCTEPDCTVTFKIKRGYSKLPRFSGRCPACRRARHNRTRQFRGEEYVGKDAFDSIRINGCTLIKTNSGRCSRYIHCEHGAHANINGVPREEDCCFQAGLRNWDGWRAQ